MNLISKCQSKPCDPLWPLLAEYSEVGSGVKLLIRTSLHYSGLDSFHKLELGSFWRVWYILCLFLTRTSTCMSSLHKVLWTLVSLLVLQFDTARLAHSETRTLQSFMIAMFVSSEQGSLGTGEFDNQPGIYQPRSQVICLMQYDKCCRGLGTRLRNSQYWETHKVLSS